MRTISHTRSFEMAFRVADLFPLFSPEGEKAWVPGWDYENLMGTTELCEDYLFLTRTHDHAAAEAIWLVKKYDPESHFVEFYKIEPGEKVGVITVQCTGLAASRTKVQVTYKYTALSAAGEKFISQFNEAAYEAFIADWQTLLQRYFESR